MKFPPTSSSLKCTMFTELVTAHSDLRSHEGSIPPHLNYFIVEYIFGFFPIKSQQYSNTSMISFIITNHQYFPGIYPINGFSKFEINPRKNKKVNNVLNFSPKSFPILWFFKDFTYSGFLVTLLKNHQVYRAKIAGENVKQNPCSSSCGINSIYNLTRVYGAWSISNI